MIREELSSGIYLYLLLFFGIVGLTIYLCITYHPAFMLLGFILAIALVYLQEWSYKNLKC
jgi:hypothetical protein